MLTDHIFHCIFSLQGSWIFRRERDRHRARERQRERERDREMLPRITNIYSY